jgi:hypothetical protein
MLLLSSGIASTSPACSAELSLQQLGCTSVETSLPCQSLQCVFCVPSPPPCPLCNPQDYKLSDIALLRRTCQAGGGVTVSTRTVGGRDAIYKAAVDAAVRRCVM